MRKLARIFVEAFANGREVADGREVDVDLDALEARLGAAAATARAAWPGVAVDDAAFVRHLAGVVRGARDVAAAVAGVHAADLYLARACLDGARGAVPLFEAQYRPVIERAVARIDGAAPRAQEICQTLLARLLLPVGAGGGKQRPPALADYQGRSTLARWLGIAAQRLALNDRQASGARRRLVARLADQPLPPARGPEEGLARRRHKRAIEAALRDALGGLTERERVIMRLHLCGGVSEARIARMYAVNQATVSRWLARARRAVWTDVERRLRAEIRLLPGELESLLQAIGSDLDFSLSAVLAAGGEQARAGAGVASVVGSRSGAGRR